MKIRNVFTTMAVLLVVLMSSCDQNNDTTPPSGTAQVANSVALTSKVSAVGKSVNGKTKSGSLAAVNLGIAGNFAILSKSGITDVYKSAITGDIGSSPITGAAVLVRCNEVVGTIYTVDAAGPLPCSITNATRLTTAVGDMQTAYTDA
ncbi:ice-binding family protein, partial [Flavobacterium sp. UBA6046]